jgi:hypothetical protein
VKWGSEAMAQAVLQSGEIAALRRVFNSEFSACGHDFNEVLEFLSVQSRRPAFITTELVNGLKKSKDAPKSLDYEGNEESGLWVIAVGGLKLSRGLTLEGLSVSYFFRNALAYDTLTQMCRWFGYRDGYSDLCRLYLLEESYDHYFDVARAINSLYDDLKLMQLSRGTPRDFGLRVRSSDTALMITAKNKLGSAKLIPFSLRLWGVEVQSWKLHKSDHKNTKHFELVSRLVERLNLAVSENREIAPNGSIIFRETPYGELFDFLSQFDPIFSEKKFQKPPILSAVNALKNSGIANPTIVIFSRSSNKRTYPGIASVEKLDGSTVEESSEITIGGHKIRMIDRGGMKENREGKIFNEKSIIGDSHDLKLLFSSADLDSLNINQEDSISNKHIREGLIKSPVLVIYLFRAIGSFEGNKRLVHSQPSVAFSLHFPSNRSEIPHVEEMETTQQYYINEILRGATIEDISDEDSENDEQEY